MDVHIDVILFVATEENVIAKLILKQIVQHVMKESSTNAEQSHFVKRNVNTSLNAATGVKESAENAQRIIIIIFAKLYVTLFTHVGASANLSALIHMNKKNMNIIYVRTVLHQLRLVTSARSVEM